MANFGDENTLLKKESKDKENCSTAIKDRDEKIRLLREKQNEDRQRKLEELKAQAHAAQKFREQKDEERKKRIEELKTKECDRRQQVEERKKVIWEAEKERRDYILKKNQEREARIECKRKNERSSIVFAFGSSTPRMLDPVEAGNVTPSAFWNHRRSTSSTNVAFAGNTLTRRSSERDVSDVPKKRATSASGLDRKNEDSRHMSASMYEVFNWGHSKDERPKRFPLAIAGSHIDIDKPFNSLNMTGPDRGYKDDVRDSTPLTYNSVARRKTDLMPTVPSPRDRSYFGSRSSLGSLTPRTPGRAMSMTRLDQLAQPRRRNGEHISSIIEREKRLRSGEITPVGSITTSRPCSSMSNSICAGVVHRRLPRKPRPVSIAGTGVSTNGLSGDLINSPKLRQDKPPLPRSLHKSPLASKSPARSIENMKINDKRTPNMKTLSISKSQNSPNNAASVNNRMNKLNNADKHIPIITQEIEKASNKKSDENILIQLEQDNLENDVSQIQIGVENINIELSEENTVPTVLDTKKDTVVDNKKETVLDNKKETVLDNKRENSQETEQTLEIEPIDMSASFIAKSRITTEEEAKAALAERRRLAREDAEKQAELERLRQEEEEKLIIQQQLEEDEQQRRLEEEALILAKEQRKAEEERLALAIEETQKRDKEDRERRDEEIRLKIEREEAERKARDEAEKQRIEMAERLKKEEKEREERRKRVEAIMSRTRAKNLAKNDSENKSIDENTESTVQSNTTVDQSNNIEISQKNEIIKDKLNEYENSVTEKENSLLGSFNDNIVHSKKTVDFGNKTVSNIEETQGNGKHINNTDFFFDHKNGHHDFTIAGVKENVVDAIAINSEQLIDFNIAPQCIENFNNNSNNNHNITPTTLVTSDSQENRDLSFV